MTVAVLKPAPAPTMGVVDVISGRLSAASNIEAKSQTSFAIIGALEQAGWVIVRKRHFGGRS